MAVKQGCPHVKVINNLAVVMDLKLLGMTARSASSWTISST